MKPPFDKLARHASSYAVDRHKLLDQILKGGEKPATTFAPVGIFGTPVDDPNFKAISFDAAKAQQLAGRCRLPLSTTWL